MDKKGWFDASAFYEALNAQRRSRRSTGSRLRPSTVSAHRR